MRYLAFICSILLFASCSPEFYIEKSFEDDIPNIAVMLVFPDDVHAVNSKTGLDLDKVSDEVYDSIFYAANFLPYIWRDSFLMDFEQNLSASFQANGFLVYNESQWSDFLSLEGAAYIINITFLQLEERYTNHTDYIYKNGKLESKYLIREPEDVRVHLKNTLTLNAWVDFQEIHDTSNTTYSFYTYSEVADAYKSEMVEINSKRVYQIEKDSLTLDRALTLQDSAAPEIRNNMVDFMVNQKMEQYIGFYFNRYPSYYLRFDGKGDMIKSDQEPQYIFLKED